MSTVISPKKLIEVALPLDAINEASAREKSIRHGHPSTLHLWWARRPLAAARAVIFAQLVNDPASLWEAQNPGQKPSQQQRGAFTRRRNELFKLIAELVKWENTTNEELLVRARAEIRRSWQEVCALNTKHPEAATLFNPEKLPGLHDPFAGGGTIPLEAQRLGLEASGSDLNPVAVIINKAMIEIPPKFAGRAPVHPDAQNEAKLRIWRGAEGLAEDVRRYGAWVRDEAERRIGHLYPKAKVTKEMAEERPDLKPLVGKELTIIAWLWVRTVKSPNPAFSHVWVPLASTFVLSSKEGQSSWVETTTQGDAYRFVVRTTKPPDSASEGTKLGRGANFRCVMSGIAIEPSHIYSEANSGQMRTRLMAVVAEGPRGRLYLPPNEAMEEALSTAPDWRPDAMMPDNPRWFSPPLYGLTRYGDLFTPRQLVALNAFTALVGEARERVQRDALMAGMTDSTSGLEQGGRGAIAYAEAVQVHLALAASKETVFLNTLSRWRAGEGKSAPAFGRQAVAMVWDFADVNPFAGAGGDFGGVISGNANAIESLPASTHGAVVQAAAQELTGRSNVIISTDPPYYDNIGYADLSDYFYVWLRRSLRSTFPSLFAGMVVPKAEELVATPYRHGSKAKAESFFLTGMSAAMRRLADSAHPSTPLTIYYAFKQSETGEAVTSSTGWETFLDAVLHSGLAITGTWPSRTENATRMVSAGTNALASSIVLVCRKRPNTAATISRREFIRELNAVLPIALDEMTKGAGEDRSPVAPVDLSQAIIGPGMAVFSKYAAVLEADGTPMTVKTALQLINRFLAEDDFDADTQFCLSWFDQHGWSDGIYGEADVLARAKSTSVGGLADAGVVVSKAGKVHLRRPSDYPVDWEALKASVWESLHQLIRAFRADGEAAAGGLLGAMKARTEAIRQLAYRLYTLCERRSWADDARAYNELVTSWSAIEAVASAVPDEPQQLAFPGVKP